MRIPPFFFNHLNDSLGGCSLEQEGEDFFVVGADSVRKKLGSSHLVIPLYFPYLSMDTTFDRVISNVWTNDTGKDVTLYAKINTGIAGNASSIYIQFQTSDGTVLHNLSSAGNSESSFTVPNGKTLQFTTPRNVYAMGVLVDYDFSVNVPLED